MSLNILRDLSDLARNTKTKYAPQQSSTNLSFIWWPMLAGLLVGKLIVFILRMHMSSGQDVKQKSAPQPTKVIGDPLSLTQFKLHYATCPQCNGLELSPEGSIVLCNAGFRILQQDLRNEGFRRLQEDTRKEQQ